MVGMLSDKGAIRNKNQDSIGFYYGDNFEVYIVADGIGGNNAGEIASYLAVKTIINNIKKFKIIDNAKSQIIESIQLANKKIYQLASKKLEYKGMGTTITACIKSDNKIIVANVGDSGCFVVNKERIDKVTKDHSYVQKLLDEGIISNEQALNHPYRSIITRYLGTKAPVEIDTFEVNLDEVIKVILFTDGLLKQINLQEIISTIISNTNQDACNKLIELSKLGGSEDNISIIIFDGGYTSGT